MTTPANGDSTKRDAGGRKPSRLSRLQRYSLRSMFVLMTVCCLVVGLWSVYVNPYRMQRQSLATVNRLQGSPTLAAAEGPAWNAWLVTRLLGDEAFVRVVEVDLAGKQVNDDALRSLAG